jgi:hypothetical protein
LALHPYPQANAPNDASDDANQPDYADLPQIPKVERALDRLLSVYGSSRQMPIYSTEFGYKTDPPFPGGVPPEQAAYYLNWAEYIGWSDHRVLTDDQFLLMDPRVGSFDTGLEFIGGKRKPSYDAYRMPIYLPVTTGTARRKLEVWGGVRPAYFARRDSGHEQKVQIQFRPAQGSSFRTVRTLKLKDPYGYFDVEQAFLGSGEVRLAWSYPHGGEIFSRGVTITLH